MSQERRRRGAGGAEMAESTAYEVRQAAVGDDPRIHYTVYSPHQISGDTLVFASGTGLTQDCWHQWTDYLATRGKRCITLDYRAHGASTWSHPIKEARLQGYVDDISSVLQVEGLDSRQIVLVGNSMGGGVALRFAEQHNLAGLVIMGSFAFGLWAASSAKTLPYLLTHHPLVLLRTSSNPSVLFNTPARAREFLLGQNADEEIVSRCVAQVYPESSAVLSELVKAQPLPLKTSHVLFLAADSDRLAAPNLVRQSADQMQGQFQQFHGSHLLMLVGEWQGAADAVLRFATGLEGNSHA
jgi:pimeloyl-ACP methyl ester carboxylesterase